MYESWVQAIPSNAYKLFIVSGLIPAVWRYPGPVAAINPRTPVQNFFLSVILSTIYQVQVFFLNNFLCFYSM
jgi:hypothetical protein